MARFAVVTTFPFGQSRHDCKPCEACQLLPPRTVMLASALFGPVVDKKVWFADSGPNRGTRERLASSLRFLDAISGSSKPLRRGRSRWLLASSSPTNCSLAGSHFRRRPTTRVILAR